MSYHYINTSKWNLFFGLLAVLFFLLWLLHDCRTCQQDVVRVKHDTIYPSGKLLLAKSHAPKIQRAVAVKIILQPMEPVGVVHTADSVTTSAAIPRSDSLYYYSDTVIEVNNYHLVINDTVQGVIIGRSVWLANLKPQITTTVKHRLPDKPKVYLGASVVINARHLNRWGAGPSAMVTIPKLGAVSYTYDARNNAHAAGVYALLRFKK